MKEKWWWQLQKGEEGAVVTGTQAVRYVAHEMPQSAASRVHAAPCSMNNITPTGVG